MQTTWCKEIEAAVVVSPYIGGSMRSTARRRAFTLVELLVTVTIIAIMASLFLGGMYSSRESGRVAATKATIAKINNLVMQRWESYRTRRVPITIVTTNGVSPIQAAGWRLDALRELMRCELPDHWNDVSTPPLTAGNTLAGRPPIPIPSLWTAYNRKYLLLNPSSNFQEAECLYMICTTGISDEMDNREQFRSNEIGDVDGDGAQEFIDAWGTPIMFLRWAPGFHSELQTHNDPDPFDPRFVYPSVNGASGASSTVYSPSGTQTTPTFALYPLIFSAGPDSSPSTNLYGIVASSSTGGAFGYVPISGYSTNNNNDPFCTMLSSNASLFTYGPIGTRADLDSTPPASTTINSSDDIHNHLMGTR